MGYTLSQARDFINRIAPMMQAEAKKRGYMVCSTAIAQAIIEGAAGTSILASRYHNHFGMKCGSKWKGNSVNLKTKEEYTPGTLTNISANFRAYDSDEAGIKGYYDFISTKNYENLRTAGDYKQYAEMLKADKYATSSTYVNTLCKTVEKYNLTQYDSKQEVPLHIQSRRTLKRGMSGSDVVYLQRILQNLGYDIGGTGVDGIYGRKTADAVGQFQSERMLVSDKICGPKTWSMIEKYT